VTLYFLPAIPLGPPIIGRPEQGIFRAPFSLRSPRAADEVGSPLVSHSLSSSTCQPRLRRASIIIDIHDVRARVNTSRR